MPRAVIRRLKTSFGSFFLLVVLADATDATDATEEQWGIFDISLSGTTNGSPFVDVQFSARVLPYYFNGRGGRVL
jgi:hypothetical protein